MSQQQSPPDPFEGFSRMSSGEIRMVRELLALTQADMAHRLDISRRTLEDWEGGKSTAPSFLRLALQLISMRIADERGNPRLTTDKLRHLAARVANLEHPAAD